MKTAKRTTKKIEYTNCYYGVAASMKDQQISYNILNRSFPLIHDHDFFEIVIILDGEVNHYTNGKIVKATKGYVFFLRPKDLHAIYDTNKKTSKHISIIIKPDYIENYFNLISNDLYSKIINKKEIKYFLLNQNFLTNVNEFILNYYSNKKSETEQIFALKTLTNSLLDEIIKTNFISQKILPDWLTKLLAHINENIHEDISVEELTKNAPYSYSRLSRIFKSYMGKTITEYITTYKMEEAIVLLQSTNKSILDISLMLQYKSISHFNRTFKNYCGYTPLQIRKRVK